jgi:hypothetical protein
VRLFQKLGTNSTYDEYRLAWETLNLYEKIYIFIIQRQSIQKSIKAESMDDFMMFNLFCITYMLKMIKDRKAHKEIAFNCYCCKNNGRFVCSQCEIAIYCSRECQKADWPIHKTMCAYEYHCEWCYSECEKACSRCQEALYCDELCQRKHWLFHRKTCKPVDLEIID